MKILILVDYYAPFNPGGSEWSVYYLSKALSKRSIDNLVLTPNYGAKNNEVVSGVKVLRFPFYRKILKASLLDEPSSFAYKSLKESRKVINPVWQNNPFFFLWSAYWIYKIAKEYRVDLIHINAKFTIPGGIIASWFLGVPVVVTLRDKQLLCSIGKCFFTKDRYKACGFFEYLSVDLPWFYSNYIANKTLFNLIYAIFGAIWTRFAHAIIANFAKQADQIIAISKSQKKYLEKNGYSKVRVIYNSAEIKKVLSKNRKGILYAGKLSLGKGVYELFNAIPEVLKKHPVRFIFAGGIDEKDKILKEIKEKGIKKYVKLLGGVDHYKLQSLFKTVSLVVMPSVYPEAFGRVALEALASGTPVVVSDRGGLPEIVEEGKTGEVSNLEVSNLSKKIIKVLDKNSVYINNIQKRYKNLKRTFEKNPIDRYVQLYMRIIR